MVGAIGFEPTTSWSQTRRATGLRYALTSQSSERELYALADDYCNLIDVIDRLIAQIFMMAALQ